MSQLQDGYYDGVITFHEYTTLGSDNKDVFQAQVALGAGETLETKDPVHGEGEKVTCTFFLDDPTQFFDFLEKTGKIADFTDLSQLGGEGYDDSPLKDLEVTVRLKTTTNSKGKTNQYANLYAKKKVVTAEEKKVVAKSVSSKLGEMFKMKREQALAKASGPF